MDFLRSPEHDFLCRVSTECGPPETIDERTLRWLVATGGNEPRIGSLVERVDGVPCGAENLADRFVTLVAQGALVLEPMERRTWHDDGRPRATSIKELVVADASGLTWVSVDVRHELGLSTARLDVVLASGSGRERSGRLDANGHWRADGIQGARCTLRLLVEERFRPGRMLRHGGTAHRPQVPNGTGFVEWVAGRVQDLELETGRHHWILITPARSPYCPST